MKLSFFEAPSFYSSAKAPPLGGFVRSSSPSASSRSVGNRTIKCPPKKGDKNLLSVLHRQELLLLHPLRLQVHLQDHQPLPVHLQLYASVNSFQKTTLLQEKIFTFLQIIFILTILIININCNQIIITVLMMLIRTRTSALRKQRNC